MMDLRLSSIQAFYQAMARGEVARMTVPAFNLRGMTEELAEGIFEAAQETQTGVFILEIARSEMEYTGQPASEFVSRVLVGANRVGWKNHIFIQGDHSQAKVESPGKIADGEIEMIKKLIDAEIASGFYNIDIDASTLVDTSLSRIEEQQRPNASVTSELAQYIRSRQPKEIVISIGGEIGHIGDKNSTEDDLRVFMQIFSQTYPPTLAGLSKISVQTGTSHGGHLQSDITIENVQVDFDLIERLTKLAREHGMAGVVQHGASTLPDHLFSEFPRKGAVEIHLSTGWQNMIFDHPQFPVQLKADIDKWLSVKKRALRQAEENDEQFFYRTRKYAWGAFRGEFDKLSPEFKLEIKNEMKKRCLKIFGDLGVMNTQAVIEKYIPLSRRDSIKRIHSVEEANVEGKRVIVRVDWNVTLGKALQIVDDTRIVRTIPTIKWLLEHGAKQIILMSHLGKAEEKRSLEPVVRYAEKLLGEEIGFNEDARVMMRENLRLNVGEEQNDPDYARELASMGDIYVNEAFGECHREVASIVGIPKLLPAYAGLWLEDEVEAITRVRESASHPLVVVMGGAKVEDKLKLLELLSHRADVLLLGGKLANEFVERGVKLGGPAKVVTPVEGDQLLDIGETTQKEYAKVIALAKTVIWNGPMGKVEDPSYRSGTEAIYQAISANIEAYTVVGGGDTLAAISEEEHISQIDHVSTGGGAMLKLLESGSLVGIEALVV